jgi:putative glycosyltransferase (TIGR04348 family)
MPRPRIALVTPALAAANNGNWQTAHRWAKMLAPLADVGLASQWQRGDEDLLIALHARRSAASIQAWKARHPDRPLLLVLTGTDLYRDIDDDPKAQASLHAADRLVVLNTLGPRRLPAALQARCSVVLQSARALKPWPEQARARRHLRVLMVGHLRDEKDPRTYWRAVQSLAERRDIRFAHVGAALDADLGNEARALAARCTGFHWLGGLTHAATRQRIRRADVLVHASRMEGGAHVVIEALRAGTPVIASRIAGNLGLLDEDWPAVFDVGDARRLSALLAQARDDPAMLPALRARALHLAPRYAPEAEAATLKGLVSGLLQMAGAPDPTTGTTATSSTVTTAPIVSTTCHRLAERNE